MVKDTVARSSVNTKEKQIIIQTKAIQHFILQSQTRLKEKIQ